MSMFSEREEKEKLKEEDEILKQALNILKKRFPDDSKDEWGFPRHFTD